MEQNDQVGKVQTVTGPVDPAEMGITLTHEHLLFDAAPLGSPPSQASSAGSLLSAGLL